MTKWQQIFLIGGALYGLLRVAAGAFGAHLLKSKISSELLNIFEVAVRYQMYHALALLGLGMLLNVVPSLWLTLAGGLFIGGTAIFSGSLYLLIFSGIRAWGAVTPIGGFLLILGWLSLLLGAILGRSP